jgi:hypothetical protein
VKILKNVVSMRPARRDISSVDVMEQKSNIQTLGVYFVNARTALSSVCPTAGVV